MTASLTPEHLELAALLADTDLRLPALSGRMHVSIHTAERMQHDVYLAYGVHSRAALRTAMLGLELAPVGAR